ncbi:MAG: hypothetical protein U0903_09620 [Planctomycetales bacterium]
MAIRIVCPSCQKKLNAPDTVRGKSVRCPGCQTKIKVPEDAPEIVKQESAAPATPTGPQKSVPGGANPSGKLPRTETGKLPRTTSGKQKIPTKAPDELADSREFLTNLNLKEVEDKHATVCIKCGARISDEDALCPVCGVDQATGELPEQKAKGTVNASAFYRGAFGESWRFLMEYKGLIAKSELYILMGVGLGCLLAMAFFWCVTLPPKAFIGVIMVLCFMSAIGWQWHMTVETTHSVLSKRLLKLRVNYDPFTCIAYGLKFVFWSLIFLLPTLILGGVIWWVLSRSGNDLAGGIIFGVLNGLVFLMFPIAMGHFTMPVQSRAWVMPKLAPLFFRLLGPTLFWWLLFLTVNLVPLAGLAAVGAIYGTDLLPKLEYLESYHTEYRQYSIEKEKLLKGTSPPQEPQFKEIPGLAEEGWTVIGCLMGCAAWWAVSSVFLARSMSMYVQIFKKPLELVAEVPEKVYVSKSDMPVREVKVIKRPKAIGMSVAMSLAWLPVLFAGAGYFIVAYLQVNAQKTWYAIMKTFLSEQGIPPENVQVWIAAGFGAAFGAAIQFSTAGRWVTFMKFGEPGYLSLIPGSNGMTVMKLAGRDPNSFLALLVPWIRKAVMEDIAAKFDQDKSFALGLFMFPFAYWPSLGWSDLRHSDVKLIKGKKSKGKKAASGDEDEEKDDYEPPV